MNTALFDMLIYFNQLLTLHFTKAMALVKNVIPIIWDAV